MKSTHPQSVILGENWQNASVWLSPGDQWDSVTNFDGFTQPVSEWITGLNYDGKPARLSASEFDRWLRLTRGHYPGNVQRSLSNHLGNHDISRFAQRAQGDEKKIALALLFQMTYLGPPTLYYGDEYGMMGASDPDDRRTFDWSKDDGKNELIARAHQLIQIRNKYSALRTGSFITLDLNDKNNTYAFGRLDKQNRIAVALNGDALPHDVQVSVRKLDIPADATLTDELSGTKYQAKDGVISLNLPAYGGALLSF
jgi:alpha-glucosidase